MRARVGGYKRLRVWQQAKVLVLDTYRVTRRFPPDERFGMTSQLRRAATGITSCIAEGSGRPTRPDYARFVGMAYSSLLEVESTFDIAHSLGFLNDAEHQKLSVDITSTAIKLLALYEDLRSSSEDGDS